VEPTSLNIAARRASVQISGQYSLQINRVHALQGVSVAKQIQLRSPVFLVME